MTDHTISPELLEILRCPYCVSGETRMPGDDPGRLQLVNDGKWLYSPESGYKYPIKEGIPVMLIEEGRKWKDTPIEELPDPGLLVEPAPMGAPSASFVSTPSSGPDPRLIAAGIVAALAAVLLVVFIASRRK
ncbi:MAG TPA: hypothetical protein P5526_04835 [Anaerolineae bacterium]|nr:hypothetical protein [Anaerolineales bacterium]HRV91465.1 hypothetical protein [Anaerolineae bacterium]